MNVTRVIQLISEILAIALVYRIFLLRLHNVYKVFSFFLLFEVLSTALFFIEKAGLWRIVDYRIVWMSTQVVAWTLSLWMVYALLRAILARLPGILKFSQKVLNVIFPLAVLAACLSLRPEYSLLGGMAGHSRIGEAVLWVLLLERVISTIALLVLVIMLAFVLWFPVQMPRNLAVFSVGFIIYFAAKNVLLLVRSFSADASWSTRTIDVASDAISVALIGCLIYWLVFLTRKGEKSPVRIGHSWRAEEQGRLIGQLEAMNSALLRASRR